MINIRIHLYLLKFTNQEISCFRIYKVNKKDLVGVGAIMCLLVLALFVMVCVMISGKMYLNIPVQSTYYRQSNIFSE